MKTCPICDNSDEKLFVGEATLASENIYSLIQCLNCEATYFHPIPDRIELESFYKNYHKHSTSSIDLEKDYNLEKAHGYAFGRKLRKLKKEGRFLEVGCSYGFFLNGIRNITGWDIYGTEIDEDVVRFNKEKLSLNVMQGELSDIQFPQNYFDFIYVKDVLEHMPDPISFLRECKRTIKSDGILQIYLPNGAKDVLDFILFWKMTRKPPYSSAGHIFFFSPRTIRFMFNKIGFKLISAKTYNIKRGLRAQGILPKKKDWKDQYLKDTVVTKKKQKRNHSDFYYSYKVFVDNLRMLPGMHKFGHGILCIVKPDS